MTDHKAIDCHTRIETSGTVRESEWVLRWSTHQRVAGRVEKEQADPGCGVVSALTRPPVDPSGF